MALNKPNYPKLEKNYSRLKKSTLNKKEPIPLQVADPQN